MLSISFMVEDVVFFSVLFVQLFHPSFYLVILLLPEFFMVVLHDLIHSSRVSVIPSCEVHVLILPFSAGVLPKSFQSYSFLISF